MRWAAQPHWERINLGIGRWLKKKGVTGGIARSVASAWSSLARARPGMAIGDVCRLILDQRYASTRHAFPLAARQQEYLLRQLESGNLPQSPRTLARLIWEVEFGTDPACAPQRAECFAIMEEEFDRLGIPADVSDSRARNAAPAGDDLAAPHWLAGVQHLIGQGDAHARELWLKDLHLPDAPVHARHGLAIVIAGIATAQHASVNFDALCALCLEQLEDPHFRAFVSGEEARGQFHHLFQEARAAAASTDVEKVTAMVQTFLILGAGGYDAASEHAEQVCACAAAITANSVAGALLLR
jgi:hypothetical protein